MFTGTHRWAQVVIRVSRLCGIGGRAPSATVRGTFPAPAIGVLLITLGASPTNAQWTGTSLHPAPATTSFGLGSGPSQQTGYAFIGEFEHAILWSGTAASWIDLHPAGAVVSFANSAGDGQQVGYAALGAGFRASLWTGTAASWVDLHPAGATDDSYAYGVDDGQQVGSATINNLTSHASLWSGSAASWVDLNPAGATASVAYAVSDGRQAGIALINGNIHAGFWSGTAASWTDLHPAGVIDSTARAISGEQQAGWTFGNSGTHASVWTGTAASWVDLHPAGATRSEVFGANRGEQVGYAVVGGLQRASLWSGTADSWVNLHAFLPFGFTTSQAESISSDGTNTYITGHGVNALNGRTEAVLWTRPCTTPAITAPPQTQSVCAAGNSAQFVVTPAGTGPFTYQWHKGTTPISTIANPSAATATLTLTSVQPADVGTYTCIVSNACGSTTSGPAGLTLSSASVSITPNARRCPGETATFSLTVNTPSPPTAYQWRKDGVAIDSIANPSAATASLIIAAVSTADAGSYDCLITAPCGVIDSNNAGLLVANVIQSPTDQVACTGASVSFTAVLDLDRPGKQWLKNGTPISGNPTANTTTLVLNNVLVADSGTYTFRFNANGGCGTVTTSGAALTVTSGAPVILTQPANTSACVGGSASLSVVLSSPGPFMYTWHRVSTPIDPLFNPSAATATLTITGIGPADAADYHCTISNACVPMGIASNPATISVCTADADCAGGVTADDIFAFLDAWFLQNGQTGPGLSADFNDDELVTADDIFAFLDAWFAQNGVCGA